jgi:P-type Cu+ transporter
MSEQAQLTFPVLGMTCANCVATVERSSKKVEGVTDASVNFASEKVTVTYDPTLTDAKTVTAKVIERVNKAGYEIPKATLVLQRKVG